jgi:hypothetical protein
VDWYDVAVLDKRCEFASAVNEPICGFFANLGHPTMTLRRIDVRVADNLIDTCD